MEESESGKNKGISTKIPILLFTSCVVFVGFLCLTYPLLFSKFFGDKYIIAYPSFTLMLWILPFYFVSFLLVPVLNSYDKVSFVQKTNIIGASVNLLIDALLVKQYGIIAAAVGTFTCYVLRYFILIVAALNIFKIRNKRLLLISATLCIFLILYLLNVYIFIRS